MIKPDDDAVRELNLLRNNLNSLNSGDIVFFISAALCLNQFMFEEWIGWLATNSHLYTERGDV